MITDKDTNFVYFSDLFKSKSELIETFKKIANVLDKHNVDYDFLHGTKDIWVRDYMPIQINLGKNIEYKYDPDYLQAKKYRKLKSYPDWICHLNNIPVHKTDLIIDGGNIIKSNNAVIMTDKVLTENKDNYKKEEIIEKLKDLFETDKLALIPWDCENDEYGHADGMIRFIDNNTVLLQQYFDNYDERFKNQLYGELDRIGLTWKKIEFKLENPDIKRNWAYINFLQTKDLILLPRFGIEEDQQALEQIRQYFSAYYTNKQIENVDLSDIVQWGGALNCITWTIKN